MNARIERAGSVGEARKPGFVVSISWESEVRIRSGEPEGRSLIDPETEELVIKFLMRFRLVEVNVW